MFDHSAGGLSLEYDPCAIPFFEIVGNLHSRSRWRACLRAELHVCVCLIPVDRSAFEIHIHRVHVQRTDSPQVLHDSRTNGLVIALLSLAAGEQENREEESES